MSCIGNNFDGRPQITLPGGALSAPQIQGLSKHARKILASQTQPVGPTLFMGNLGFEATPDSVRGMIEAHELVRNSKGKTPSGVDGDNGTPQKSLKKVRMGTFEDSGLCKG